MQNLIFFSILAKKSYLESKKKRIEAQQQKCERDLAAIDDGEDTSEGEWDKGHASNVADSRERENLIWFDYRLRFIVMKTYALLHEENF